MKPQDISIIDYNYDLPEHRIAKYPLAKRDESKLLVYKSGKIESDHFFNVATHLPSSAVLVFNNTKVLPARLHLRKPTGGLIEVFCLEPWGPITEMATAMEAKGSATWKCLVGGAAKWKSGQLQLIDELTGFELYATCLERLEEGFVIQFSWQPNQQSWAEVLQWAGSIPLPPYLNRPTESTDIDRYQTVYAQPEGSVAAPTAGLHFTASVFDSLQAQGIEQCFVTLHVGAGTFKPVKADRLADHIMHAEWMEIPISAITAVQQAVDKGIIAVGTTSLRTLESLYWMGVKAAQSPNATREDIEVHQWDPYALLPIEPIDAITALLDWMKRHQLNVLFAQTQLLIAPGYNYRMIKGIITNFHQPKSTLLLLIAALIGEDWKNVYSYALANDYRFLSYGDSSLLIP